jgi:parallel beta-helix repeat protein
MLLKRFSVTVLPAYVLALALQACGGGGNGGSGQPTTPETGSTPPITQATSTATTAAAATPTPPPAATPTTPLPGETPGQTPGQGGGSILDALKNAAPGSTVLVTPGTYPALVVQAGDLQGPVTLLADVATAAAISITGVTGLTIDGITVQGGTEEGILVLNSPNTVVRNCVTRNNRGDGVFVQSSDGSVVFDNLAYQNTKAGIRVYSSNNISVFNNTVSGNSGAGIFIGTASAPSTGVVVENNIFNGNLGNGIEVDTGIIYTGDYNLNTDGYAPEAPVGSHDIDADPAFLSPALGEFQLLPQLDDCTGGSPAVNAGNPSTPTDLVAILEQRTTREDGRPDCVGAHCCTTLSADPTPQPVDLQPGQVDLGYHYPAPATATPSS